MKTLTREAKERTLTLTAEVKDYALSLRTELATGKVESGRKKYEIEVSVPVNGSAVLVQISQVATKKNPSPGWRTYAIRVEPLIRAVFEDYKEAVKTDPVRKEDE
jgi:hypothetical protein